MPSSAADHRFVTAPHRTLVGLSVPVLVSLIAEPLTGLADTAFVKELGAAPQAALGVGTAVLSSLFWLFNFLAVGTQTEVARTLGQRRPERTAELTGLALSLAVGFGLGVSVLGWAGADAAARAMGATGEVRGAAVEYLEVRALGAPAVIATTAAFGAMRGLQDMRTPLFIAVAVNALNVLLDWLLIFGAGPIPALGVAGAAWASVIAQTLGAGWAVWLLHSRLGRPSRLRGRDARLLLVVGGDLLVRTGLLTLFLLLATRVATRIGEDAGAAHQAVRQVWMFTALLLDAFAATAQSLVGYFLGADRKDLARRVAAVSCIWGTATGVVLTVAMLASTSVAAHAFAPASAHAAFAGAWFLAAVFQPLNALSFVTDGVHWGTGDYRYLRNAMVCATVVALLGLFTIDPTRPGALNTVWVVTGAWITVRATLGVGRIWPGIGKPPL